MRPELPYLGAAGVALVAATVRDGHIPSLTRPAIAIIVLVVFASAMSRTSMAPVVDAMGKLLLLTTLTMFGAILYRKQQKGKVK